MGTTEEMDSIHLAGAGLSENIITLDKKFSLSAVHNLFRSVHQIFSINANLVDNELIAGFEWNLENPNQIDLTW